MIYMELRNDAFLSFKNDGQLCLLLEQPEINLTIFDDDPVKLVVRHDGMVSIVGEVILPDIYRIGYFANDNECDERVVRNRFDAICRVYKSWCRFYEKPEQKGYYIFVDQEFMSYLRGLNWEQQNYVGFTTSAKFYDVPKVVQSFTEPGDVWFLLDMTDLNS